MTARPNFPLHKFDWWRRYFLVINRLFWYQNYSNGRQTVACDTFQSSTVGTNLCRRVKRMSGHENHARRHGTWNSLVFTRFVGQSCRLFAGRFKDYYSMSCLAAKSTDSMFLSDKIEIIFLPMLSEYDDTEMIWFRVPSASFTATSCCCHVLCFCATYCAHCRRYLGQVVATTTQQRQLPI